jgi:eukaryotic-like serine/threonine-protein kinase
MAVYRGSNFAPELSLRAKALMSSSDDDLPTASFIGVGQLDQTLTRVGEGFDDSRQNRAPSALAGKTIHYVGDYEIVDEIARGGMGAVLLGRDPNLGRELAIKVLLKSHADNAGLTERFIEEAQISGQLQHPGIAPVYEMGHFEDRRPFFSMKLVKGRTLASLLAERRFTGSEQSGTEPTIGPEAAAQSNQQARDRAEADRQTSSIASDLPRFLSIFVQVSQTLGYAHARGVIHRDIKPSNIMVGTFGEVQVMDWGLAKVLHGPSNSPEHGEPGLVRTLRRDGSTAAGVDNSQTRAGSVLGTPAYMAPEQARGELDLVDERSDVFALGAILLEMLTGKPPYADPSLDACSQAAEGRLDGALTRLSASAADPDLIAITRRCLAVKREDRPRNGGEVAAAVTDYLSGVQQRLRAAELARAEAQARAAEERKRRRVEVGLAVAVLALTAIGGLTGFRAAQRRQEVVTRVELALAEATSKLDQARVGQGDVELWAEAVQIARRAEAVLAGDASPELGRRVQELVEQVETEAEAARRDRHVLEALIDARVSLLDRGLAATDAAYAAAFGQYGIDFDKAPTEDSIQRLAARPAAIVAELSPALDHWASVSSDLRRGRERSSRLLAIAAGLDRSPHHAQIRAAIDHGQTERLRELARIEQASKLPPASATLLARALVGAGDTEAAVALLKKAQQRYPDDLWVNYDLAAYLRKLSPPQDEEAVRYYTAARALHPTVAHELGHVLEDLGRGEEAIEVFLDLERRAPDEFSHPSCGGTVLRQLGREDQALAAFDRAIAAGRLKIKRDADDADAHYNLAMALRGRNLYHEALDQLHAALHIRPEFAEALSMSGVVLDALGRKEEATTAYREALKLQPGLLTARGNLATALQEQGRLDDAIAEFQELIRRGPRRALLHYNLGNALDRKGEHSQAIASYQVALRSREDLIEARVNMGISQALSGDFDAALVTLRDAVARRPDFDRAWYSLARALAMASRLDELSVLAEQKPNMPSVQHYLGRALHEHGRFSEALLPLSAAQRLAPNDAQTPQILGICLSQLGQHGEAIIAFRRAIELAPDDAEAHLNLGTALYAANDYPGADAAFRQSLTLRPEDAVAHYNLGNALCGQGNYEDAVDSYKEATRLAPGKAEFQYRLGIVLEESHQDFAAAINAYRSAILSQPDYPDAREHLGLVLYQAGKMDEAIATYREAIRLHPELADGHYGLATLLRLLGRGEEAIAGLREAVRLNPKHPEALCNLGHALCDEGHFEEAQEFMQRGHDEGSKRNGWSYPSAEWLADCERLVEQNKKLVAKLKGEFTPTSDGERIALAQIARRRKLYVAAAQLLTEAFAANQALADNLDQGHRHQAARLAAQSAAGTGADENAPDAAERTRWRRQAIDWLRADLALLAKEKATASPARRVAIDETIRRWQEDPELTSIRDSERIRSLPTQEQEECQQFWSDVAAFLGRPDEKFD